jgi:hypothetical protein
MHMTALLVGAIDSCRGTSPVRRDHRMNRLYGLATVIEEFRHMRSPLKKFKLEVKEADAYSPVAIG